MADEKKKQSAGTAAGMNFRRAVQAAAADAPRRVARQFMPLGLPTGLVQGQLGTVRDFIAGASGVDRAKETERRKIMNANAQALAPREAVPAALAQGRAAEPKITTTEKLDAFVNELFSGPVTLEQAQMAAGMIPAAAKAPTAKDKAIATATSVADSMYEQDLTTIEQSLTKPSDIQKARLSATGRYYKNLAALGGADLPLIQPIDEE